MLYDQLINLIEPNKEILARMLIEQTDKQVGKMEKVANAPATDARIRNIITWLDIMLTYVKDGDTEIWRNEITQQIEMAVRYKYSIEDLLKVTQILYQGVDDLIDKEIADEKMRERFHRRIQGVQTSATTIARVVVMRLTNNANQHKQGD